MKEKCDCGRKTIINKPPKFSIEDSYGSYRRKANYEKLKKFNLI